MARSYGIVGKFLALDVATLTTMLAQWQACLTTIAAGNQAYSLAGRSFTRANLAEVSEMVAELAYALKVNSGGLRRTVYTGIV
jgi:hypothetical protein